MSIAILFSRAQFGIQAPRIRVEVHLAGGLPGLTIVGLPSNAVREAKDRVRSALQSCGFSIPPRRITVNLAPADLPKDGARFDLAIALGILQASGQLNVREDMPECLGELSLSGELRQVEGGVLSSALAAKAAGQALLLPTDNIAEAALSGHGDIRHAANLLDVCAAWNGQRDWQQAAPSNTTDLPPYCGPDMAAIRGQVQAKRALLLAAAGRHHLLLQGPPGAGKSLLAQALPGICPELDEAEALEAACVHSHSQGHFSPQQWRAVPFRHPHHSASVAALVGGGSRPRPGEISLAHRGILFLDELPEFRRDALEALREPLETGQIRISRAQQQMTFPAAFQLLAAMNPCPCGYLGDASGRCHCSREQVQRYQSRISGPLRDRMDMHIRLNRVPVSELMGPGPSSAECDSATLRQQVERARERQMHRAGKLNSELPITELETQLGLRRKAQQLLFGAAERLDLSARAVHRSLRLARTIADVEDMDSVAESHVAEALQYRISEA